MSRRQKKSSKMQTEIRENEMCAYVGRQLERNFPGYKWFVQCTWHTGVVTIKNMNLHGDYGFVLHLGKLLNEKPREGKLLQDDKLPLAVEAGGEMLERVGLPAGPRPGYKIDVERDLRNNAIMDLHGV